MDATPDLHATTPIFTPRVYSIRKAHAQGTADSMGRSACGI
jgi:hypothetical protein